MSRKDKSIETKSKLVDGCLGDGRIIQRDGGRGVIVNSYKVSLQGDEHVELGEMSDI